MNMQAMMKQAQKLQKDMLNEQEKINNMEFEGKSSLVTTKINGHGELIEVKIEAESLDKEEIEMLEDMILIAVNDAKKKLDKETESRMGMYTKGLPGLF